MFRINIIHRDITYPLSFSNFSLKRFIGSVWCRDRKTYIATFFWKIRSATSLEQIKSFFLRWSVKWNDYIEFYSSAEIHKARYYPASDCIYWIIVHFCNALRKSRYLNASNIADVAQNEEEKPYRLGFHPLERPEQSSYSSLCAWLRWHANADGISR